MPTYVGVLAHQGGWDEILLIVGPLALFGGLLWLATHRADRLEAQARAASRPPGSTTDAGR